MRGSHAPCDGYEFEGRLRQEHDRHQRRQHSSRPMATRSRWRTTIRSEPAWTGSRCGPTICRASPAWRRTTRGCEAVPRDTEVLVIDAPARTHGSEMNELVRRAETILVPVLPSPIDMKACAHFMAELLELGRVQREQARLALVANRVRENTLMFEELDQYLGKLKVPYLSVAAAVDQLPARVPARHGNLRAARISRLAGLEAVGAGHEVARQQRSQPAEESRNAAAMSAAQASAYSSSGARALRASPGSRGCRPRCPRSAASRRDV